MDANQKPKWWAVIVAGAVMVASIVLVLVSDRDGAWWAPLLIAAGMIVVIIGQLRVWARSRS